MGQKRRRSRSRQLDAAVAAIQDRFGPWALVRGRPATSAATMAHLPTGFPALDRILGIGGLPLGRMCEIVGPPTSGKTTMALKLLVEAQRQGGEVGYVDQALYVDPEYAHRCGADLSCWVILQPRNRDEALGTVEGMVRAGGLAALVLDTLEFLWTDPEASSDLTATLERLAVPLAHSGTVLLILHESATTPSPALSTLAHLAAVRLQVTREGWVVRHGDVRGYRARVEVLKNKVGPAGGTASITIEFNGTVKGNGL